MLLQLIRFAISGGAVTALGTAIYAFFAVLLRLHPQLANLLQYVVAMSVGYLVHSRFSFRDHGGQRTNGTRIKFLAVSLVSYSLNAFWVWLLTAYFVLPPEWPILPMLFVTPLITFVLQRQWVFR